MEEPPPIKPPRGVKPAKETSGLLMSVIRTLSASETNEQRDREKAKLENQYKSCDRRLNELVLNHEDDLTQVMQLFGNISTIVTQNRSKIRNVKENLEECKRLLRCRRDELKNLWLEGLEYKYMLQLLEEIEKMTEVPNRLSKHLASKQYLHATKLLVEAVSLGKDTLEGVDSLKEIKIELEQKKEQLHLQLLNDLKKHLYNKPAQNVLALRRQGSSRDPFSRNSPLQRSTELRLSNRNKPGFCRNIFENSRLAAKEINLETFDIEEDLEISNLEDNSAHFMAIIIKCLTLLDKLPFAVNEIKQEMPIALGNLIQRTSQHVKDFVDSNNSDSRIVLKELTQTIFNQFKEIADSHECCIDYISKATKAHNINMQSYSLNYYWSQAQVALQTFLSDYLDIQNISVESEMSTVSETSDMTSYFSRRKPQSKKKSLFKFDSSSSALTLNTTNKSNKQDKIFVSPPHPNNILVLFIPMMCFIEEMEQLMNVKIGSTQLHQFLSQHVSNVYLKRKSEEIIDQIESSVRASDAWKGTVLLDSTTDYKPLLVSTVFVDRCIREWRTVLKALPLYSESIAEYSCKALKEYKDTCCAAYQGIVQPHSEDRRICSAAWLKDEDISRFLKSLPNWLNLKTQQETHARSERHRRHLRREQTEEESSEDVRQRNRKEAEILTSNLGEDGVTASEILSDMTLLKELGQLQESMEWFSVRMFQFVNEFRQEPLGLSPPRIVENNPAEISPPVSAARLQQLTSVAQEFDELANTCLLLLHLEVRVQCFHYLLAQTYHNKETHEPDPKVSELSKVLANVDEAMTSSLHPRKCKYIFEGLGNLIAKILIGSAQKMNVIDDAGIQRMCRNIFALQQTLTNITMTREVALDHARHYFELFFLTPEEILNGIVEKGPVFSELEYMNAFQLLTRSRGNNASVIVHLERLSDILGEVSVTV